jgi:hypothetical protein
MHVSYEEEDTCMYAREARVCLCMCIVCQCVCLCIVGQ